jgi:uncharacterized protein (DUF433 family)
VFARRLAIRWLFLPPGSLPSPGGQAEALTRSSLAPLEPPARRIEWDLMDEPHLAGHRVSVRRINALVEKRDLDPRAVADRLGLDLADVYRAVAYYHDHPGTMHDVEQRRERRIEQSLEDGAIAAPSGPLDGRFAVARRDDRGDVFGVLS